MRTSMRLDRERTRRTLTFWLRPAFVLRALTRFQRIAGFDRAVALAAGALTALIPLAIVASAILPHVDAEVAARTIINRYSLTGGWSEAVRDRGRGSVGDLSHRRGGVCATPVQLLRVALRRHRCRPGDDLRAVWIDGRPGRRCRARTRGVRGAESHSAGRAPSRRRGQ